MFNEMRDQECLALRLMWHEVGLAPPSLLRMFPGWRGMTNQVLKFQITLRHKHVLSGFYIKSILPDSVV